MFEKHFRNLFADSHRRVQRGHRVLENHSDVLSSDMHFFSDIGTISRPSKESVLFKVARRHRDQLHNRLGGHTFSGTRLPTIASVSPLFKWKFTPRIACTSPPYVLNEMAKSFTSSKRVTHITPYLRNLGSSASLNPSPTTLKPNIARQIKPAGKNRRQG